MKHYLCKYFPPRPDFIATMTDQETVLMGQHGAYLDNLLATGQIVAHGPVMDAEGGYGVSLYRIEDDQEIETITAQDPIVLSGTGHYEHFKMLHLKTRD